MKILIISGFLGAGKTTFIKDMLKKTNKSYVILENEFADYSVDKNRLEMEEYEDVNIFEMTSGCVCCNMKGDFSSKLISIENTLRPDYLIIEPSGVSVLSSLKENIKKIEYERIKIANTITIIDATTYFDNKLEFLDVMIDYFKNSNIVKLSKVENLDSIELKKIKEDILSFNENLEVITEDYKFLDENFYNTLIKDETNEMEIYKQDLNFNFKTYVFENMEFKDITFAIEFFEKIVRNYYGKVLRSKGIIAFKDYYINFDIVKKAYSCEIFEGKETTKFVFIGEDINKELLDEEISKY